MNYGTNMNAEMNSSNENKAKTKGSKNKLYIALLLIWAALIWQTSFQIASIIVLMSCAAWFMWPWCQRRMKEMERERRSEESEAERSERTQRESYFQGNDTEAKGYDERVRRIQSFFGGRSVILDSNVWMDGQGNSLADAIARETNGSAFGDDFDNLRALAMRNLSAYRNVLKRFTGSVLLTILGKGNPSNMEMLIPGIQLDEISNIRRRNPYGSLENKNADCAMQRISAFQRKGCVKIPDVSFVSDPTAYLDAWLFRLVKKLLGQNDIDLCVVTFDVELALRLRGLSQNDSNSRIEVLDQEDIITKLFL